MPWKRKRRKALGALGALCLISPPCFAQDSPNDSPREAAIAARAQGRYADAIAGFEALRTRSPEDADLLRLLGTTYAFDHQYAKGIATLEQAHALAPADRDITMALARAYLWSGDRARAGALVRTLLAQTPEDAEARELAATIARDETAHASPDRPVTLSLSQGLSRVSLRYGQRTWYDTTAAVSAHIAPDTTLTGEATREDRAGTVDTHLALTAGQRLGPGASATLTVTATPDAQFRERFGLRAGTDVALGRNLALVAQARYGEYTGGITVLSGGAGLRLHDTAERHALTVQSILAWNQGDAQTPGWSLRADSALGARTNVYLAGATYPDTEAGITRRFKGLYGGLTHRLDARIVLRAGLGWERRHDSYTRRSANLSLSIGL